MLIFISFVILAFISVSLLLQNNIAYVGWDMEFHFKRIMELKSSITHLQNIFPNFSFNEFHGSSVMTLYPYLNLFPIVFFSLFVKSNVELIYGTLFLNTLLTFIVSFYSCKDYTKSFSASYLFSIIYSLSNILLFYNLIVVDFGIIYSYIFLPLIFFGFMKTIQGNKGWIELSLGMSLLLFSHILNLFIIVGLLLVILLINLNKLNKKILLHLIYSIVLFLIITSIIWLPFLYYYLYNYNNINIPYTGQLQNIKLKDFMSGIYGSKNNNNIGFFPTITLFFAIFYYKKFSHYNKQIYWISLITIILVLFLPWKFITSNSIFKILNQFQFTNRFLIIPVMLLSFIFSLIISKYLKNNNLRHILFVLVLLLAIVLRLIVGQYVMINNLSHSQSTDSYLRKSGNFVNVFNGDNVTSFSDINKLISVYHQSYDDYIPKSSIPMSLYVNHNLGFYNDEHKIKVNHIGYNTFNFFGRESIDKLSLPIYAYSNEKLNVYLNDKPVNNYTNKNGLLTISNIEYNIKSNNIIYIKPVPDPFRITGIILSIFGWLFALGVFIKKKFIN